ncbi:hypothetical protein, conserved [Eimeria praecox]|uniref:Uncharacterized protein n=1 Tax=Eimeria praecox TaxID=51316 RepID=U6GZV1_9EIME|nr:hypothetical protein, conserved [Eimeria praecox]
MRSGTGETPTPNHMSSNFAALDSLNSKTNAHISDAGAANAGVLPSDAANHQERLEKRLQAQLRDGTRSKNVKRLEDPIAKHLLRVAGNPAYRSEAPGRRHQGFEVLVFLNFTRRQDSLERIDSFFRTLMCF